MVEPMVLVYNTDGKMQVNPEALSVLRSVKERLVVVAIAGAARVGKSYLMNCLAGVKKGFSLGSTLQSHTKGIWMWCQPLDERTGQRVLLLDTEGLGDAEKGDSGNDTSIFSLAILLSSVFIYNIQGIIDQQSMADLHFVTELSKRIQVRSQPNDRDSRDFIRFFPEFIWVIRDLKLEMKIDKKNVSADEYMEHYLRLREDENSEQNREYNNLRRCIREFFPTRRCFAFPCPAHWKKLEGLQEMEDKYLDEDFVKELKELRTYVNTHKKVKRVLGGHQITGRRFAELTETYVGMMADMTLTCVKMSVERLMEVENKAALDEALAFYIEKMSHFSHCGPEAFSKLVKDSNENGKEALKRFMEKSMYDPSEKHIGELVEAMGSHYNSLMGKIEDESQARCQEFLSKVMGSIQAKLDSGHYLTAGGYQELDSVLGEAVNKYRAATKEEVQGNAVLARFLEDKQSLINQVKVVDRKLTAEKHALEKELSRVKEEMSKRERERKAADDRRNKELLEQLRKKFEEGKKFSLEELKEAMEHTEREVEKYSSEGREEDAKRAQETYVYLKQKYDKEKIRVSSPKWLGYVLFCS